MIDLATADIADGIARSSRARSDVVMQPDRVSADRARIAGASIRESGLATGVVRMLETFSVSMLAVDRG
jgi:hypothetical protein